MQGAERAWRYAATVGTLLLVAFAVVPMPKIARYVLFVVSQGSAVAATIIGVRWHRPGRIGPWAAFGTSAAVGLAAALTYGWQTTIQTEWTYPTPADLLFLGMFPPLIAGLLWLVRARAPGRDAAALVDAALAALAVGVFAMALLVPGSLASLQPLRYMQPLLDILVLGLILRVALGGGRSQPSLLFGAAAVASVVASDTVELAYRLQGNTPPDLVAIGLLSAGILWAIAALHPSMAATTEPGTAPAEARPVPWWRFTLLAAAALLVPALQATQPLHGRGLPARFMGWPATGMVILVLVRLGLLIRDQRRDAALRAELDQRRAETRLGVLVQHSSDLVVLLDRDGRVSYATPSLQRLLGYRPAELVGRPLGAVMGASNERVEAQLKRLAGLHAGATVPIDGDYEVPHRDGTIRKLEAIATNLLGHPDVASMVLTARDVTAQRRLEDELRQQALKDPLTGLANRTLFTDRVSHALAGRRRNPETQVAILFIDLDDFKTVNDSLGHDVGDQLLIRVADRLRGCARLDDTVARLGGDEFAVLIVDEDGPRAAEDVADRILASLADPLLIGKRHVRPSASIGIAATGPEAYPAADELLRNADTAMYTVKTTGKAARTHFAAAMHEHAMRRLELVSDLESALEAGQFMLQYQPIIDITTGRVAGAEALVRWEHPDYGRVPPGEFITLAEETGAIVPLGRWVLRQALGQLAAWQRTGFADPSLTMAVNVSARQLRHPSIVDDVAAAIAAAGVGPQAVTLELTESALIADAEAAVSTLRELRALGVRIAVDDFGTGYSSLSYLGSFPLDLIKIDKSFVDRLAGDRPHDGLTRGVLSLAATLTMATVAEGIETRDQLDRLSELHCAYGQGYLFDRPLDPDAFERRLLERGALPVAS